MTSALTWKRLNCSEGKPVICMMAGNGVPIETYKLALEPLFSNYHVISAAPMALSSTGVPLAFSSWVDLGRDLAQSLALHANQKIVGMGHSFGAIVALYAAIFRPGVFQQLILIEPVISSLLTLVLHHGSSILGRNPNKMWVERTLRRQSNWATRDQARKYLETKAYFRNWKKEAFETYIEKALTEHSDGSVHLAWPLSLEAQIYSTMPANASLLPLRVSLPQTILRGENSRICSLSSCKLLSWMGGSRRLITIPNGNHFLAQERPEETGRALYQLLCDPVTAQEP